MHGKVLVAAGIVSLFCGCFKAAAPKVAEDKSVEIKAPAVPLEDNPMVAAGLEEISQKLKAQQYEAAVGNLVSMSQIPKSDAQQAAFTARLRQTEEELLRRAQAGDAAAQQNVQILGRMMTGR